VLEADMIGVNNACISLLEQGFEDDIPPSRLPDARAGDDDLVRGSIAFVLVSPFLGGSMTTAQRNDLRPSVPETTQKLKRRGLLAAGAALMAGLIGKLSEEPVSAGTDGDVVLGQNNTVAGFTAVTCTLANTIAFQGVCQTGPMGGGLEGIGSQFGVVGTLAGSGNAGAGVIGVGTANSPGVIGQNISGIGLRAESSSSFGVFGGIPATSNANTIAIYAQNYSTYAGSAPGAGGFAIYGLCANGHGLVGATAATGASAVVGATNGVPGAFAAAFYGPVVVGGDFTVVGGAKSAAVPHPDGSHRRLYCLESPESWFEDFGTGHLDCGRADVAIDPDFAALVDLTDYHIFLTMRDGHHLLSVLNQTTNGFTVEANRAVAALMGKRETDLSGTFSWRIVAKRKDITSARLAPVTIPREPTLPPPMADLPPQPSATRKDR
jgi:hypothetical protein